MKKLFALIVLALCSCGLFTTTEVTQKLAVSDAQTSGTSVALGSADTVVERIVRSSSNVCIYYSGMGVRCEDWPGTTNFSFSSHLIYLSDGHYQTVLDAVSMDTLLAYNSTSLDTITRQVGDIELMSSHRFLLTDFNIGLRIFDSTGFHTIQADYFGGITWNHFWHNISNDLCMPEMDWNNITLTNERILCVDSSGKMDTLSFSSGLPDSLSQHIYSPYVRWKGGLWNLRVWRDGGYETEAYYNAHIALTSMNDDGSNFTVHPAYNHSYITFFDYRLIANDAIGAYVISAESFPTGYGLGSLLTIYRVNSRGELSRIKQYSLEEAGLECINAWIVDSQHFAVVLIHAGTEGEGKTWLFDKNGNVVKSL